METGRTDNEMKQASRGAREVVMKATDYVLDHKGALRIDLRVNLWMRSKQIDEAVLGGDMNIVRELVAAYEMTKPLTNEREQFGEMVDRYMGRLGENIDNPDAAFCLLELSERGSDNQKLWAINILDQNLDRVLAASEKTGLITCFDLWKFRLERAFGTDEMSERYREELLKAMSGGEAMKEIFMGPLNYVKSKDRTKISRMVGGMAMALGLDRKMTCDMVDSWATLQWENKDVSEGRLREMVEKNMKVLIDLLETEGVGKEGVMKLYRDCGITHFGRYTPELLAKQLKDEGSNKPYGICLAAYDDWNGALTQDNSLEKRQQLVKSAEQLGCAVKFVEARNKVTVVRRIKELSRKFPGQKISFKYVEGHGQASNIQLGWAGKEENFLTTDDLKKGSALKLKQYYTDSCPTLFDSCSTGLEIGPAYSEFGKSYSMAPDKPGYLVWLELRKDTKGNLFFDGVYDSSKGDKPKTILSHNGQDAREMIDREKHELAEIGYTKAIKSKKAMKVAWGDSSSLDYVLKREKLNPLKKILTEKYGEGKTIEVEEGVGGIESDEKNGYHRSLELKLDLEESEDSLDWGTGFLESLGSMCRDLYRRKDEGGIHSWPEIRVMGVGENGKKIIIDKYKIDMSDLWPENLKEE